MVMRAQVGRPEGVTKPSMAPETKRTSGEADGHADGGSAFFGQGGSPGAGAWVDDGPAEAEAGAGGDEDRGEFEQAVREDEAEEGVEAAGRGHQADTDTEVEHVRRRGSRGPVGRGRRRGPGTSPAAWALFVQTWAANEAAGVAGVVRLVLAAGTGELAEVVGGGRWSRLDFRVGADPPADDRRRRRYGEERGGGPTSGASGRPRRGSRCVRKRIASRQEARTGAGHRATGAGHELGEPSGELPGRGRWTGSGRGGWRCAGRG
jgi:hypothetical protein